jgi:hypothetical protein
MSVHSLLEEMATAGGFTDQVTVGRTLGAEMRARATETE